MLSWALTLVTVLAVKWRLSIKQGNVLDYGAYYLTNSEKLRKEAQKVLADKIRKFKVTLFIYR